MLKNQQYRLVVISFWILFQWGSISCEAKTPESDIAADRIVSQHKLEAEGENDEPLIFNADNDNNLILAAEPKPDDTVWGAFTAPIKAEPKPDDTVWGAFTAPIKANKKSKTPIPLSSSEKSNNINGSPLKSSELIKQAPQKNSDIISQNGLESTDIAPENSETIQNGLEANNIQKSSEITPNGTEPTKIDISDILKHVTGNNLETNNLNRNEPLEIQPGHDAFQSQKSATNQRPNHIPFNSISSMFGGMFGGMARTLGGGAQGNLQQIAKTQDPEVERAEKLNKGFEKVIQFVNIMGQVDSFLTDRTKAVMRRLAYLADPNAEEDDRYRRASHRRHYY